MEKELKLTKKQAGLLQEITNKHNETALENYRRGELDFVPKDITISQMLDVILLDFYWRMEDNG